LHPEAVDEVETRYDTLLSSVTRLHREISNLNKRASVRPAPEGTVAELAKATCANSFKCTSGSVSRPQARTMSESPPKVRLGISIPIRCALVCQGAPLICQGAPWKFQNAP
jgi:hypothetical protein